ncbi:MAG: chromate transporter [Eubacterium sp.]|nr:chromate transporter [Eubacterium sp.]
MIYLQLFWEFFKVGLFAVGGGLATLPFLEDMAVRTGWFTTDQITDMLAVSECTPGAIGINMATYAGFQTAGVPGAVCATIGIITPAIIVIFLIAKMLKKFQDNKYVQAVFSGLRPASSGLIAAVCIGVGLVVLFDVGGMGVEDVMTGLFRSSGSGSASTAGNLITGIRWKAVALTAILLPLMNLGKTDRFKDNAILKKLSTLHPAYFLAASALIGIIFSFAR